MEIEGVAHGSAFDLLQNECLKLELGHFQLTLAQHERRRRTAKGGAYWSEKQRVGSQFCAMAEGVELYSNVLSQICAAGFRIAVLVRHLALLICKSRARTDRVRARRNKCARNGRLPLPCSWKNFPC
jgi:hypothetical protein